MKKEKREGGPVKGGRGRKGGGSAREASETQRRRDRMTGDPDE